MLERAWQEAEEIAAVADRLAIPDETEARRTRLLTGDPRA